MKLLAIDTSGPAAGAATYVEGRIVCRAEIEDKKTHSQKIMGLIEFVLVKSNLAQGDLDAIAVSTGPGSFTGLRIGLCIAKAMAQALEIPLIGVNTLDALCYTAWGRDVHCAVMDARRGEVYCAAYHGDELVVAHGARPIGEFLDRVSEMDANAMFCGDGVRVYREHIEQSLGTRAGFVPEPFLVQCAASVAMLAAKTDTSHWQNAYALLPSYYRLSQAEREAKKRQNETQ